MAAQQEDQAELEEVNRHNEWLRQQLEMKPLETPTPSEDVRAHESRKATVVSEALQVAWEGETRDLEGEIDTQVNATRGSWPY